MRSARDVDGALVPAVIHNSSYFFITMPVYADGIVNCWGHVDLVEFREKLAEGWVVPKIPDGEAISIHGLGVWKITDGTWDYDIESFATRIEQLVEDLKASPRRFGGDGLSIFVRDEARACFWLVDLRGQEDGSIELSRMPKREVIDLDGVCAAVITGRIVASPPIGARVNIWGLGSFAIVDELYASDVDQLVKEIPDLVEEANGRPPSFRRCRAIFDEFEADPSETNRARLRVAYEAVPEHNRMYCGDMDTKDGPIRFALYGDSSGDDDEGGSLADDDE